MLRVACPLLALTLAACGVRPAPPRPMPAGAPSRIDSFQTRIPQLDGRTRTVRVYLPRGYGEDGRRYPVLYLQDAQNLYTPGLFGDWQLDETLDRLTESGRLGPLIVVGIDNGERRWDEYGPWVNPHMTAWIALPYTRPVEGGEGEAYVDFLARTLKPEIDRRYRTLRGREHTGIGGSSMGGLIAIYAGLTRPQVFSKVMAMSTAVWFAERGGAWLSDNQLLGWMRSHPVPGNVRFYLDVGTDERSRDTDPDVSDAAGQRLTYPRAYLEGSRAAAEGLLAGGVPGANLRHVVEPGATHSEAAWRGRLEGALLWLYGAPDARR